MELIKQFLKSNLLSIFISASISLIINIIGVWFSHKLSVSKTQKAMEIFKSHLTTKVYASSKLSDMEYEAFHKLMKTCGDIHLIMERLYPDKMSFHQISSDKNSLLKELADKNHELYVELNIHRAFIPKGFVPAFEEIINSANNFFVCTERHIDCWDTTKEDRKKKNDLRIIAYEQRLDFYGKWVTLSTKWREYLESK